MCNGSEKSGRGSSQFPMSGNDIGEFYGYRNDEEISRDGAIKKRARLEEDADIWLERWLEEDVWN